MEFTPISIKEYVKKHLKNNPSENEKDLRKRLEAALADYKEGVKCSCGNDIWVIGSATVGNSCFTCITGESDPNNDYEIESAIIKRISVRGRRHIDDIPPSEINGFFDDDGYEISTDLIQKPSLCITCVHNDNPQEEILCNLTRIDQKDAKEFICFGYKERK
ncbi:hypothetical protein [uncultured Cyclobacterium sp.]|uniref:hypothetical protein n=1 Tax=uncultured Cyclobacterium sp. TaxID=453820 RepID=UPI0030ED6248|tara:strand:+ start:69072 stop:69557 length:486 start_codon:yes stop_codon:yes gene_type:complete